MNNFIKPWKRSLESGGGCALFFFVLYGIAILILLIITVHNRPQINLAGLKDFSLPGIHNQLLPLLSASFLGYLSMKLARQLSVRTVNSYVLGMGSQAAYQTFPNNLWFYWEAHPSAWWVYLMAIFWVLEVNRKNEKPKENSFYWWNAPILLGMFWVDWVASSLLIVFYGFFSLQKQILISQWMGFLHFIRVPLGLGGVVLVGKYILIYAGIYPVEEGSKKLFLQADCQEGIWGLTTNSFPPQLPSWIILLTLGGISVIAILAFIKQKEKYYFHQAILLSGVATFLISKKFLSETFHSQGIYDTYLAFPLFLALFTLLPAWLETLNKHTGIFVLMAFIMAFCASCIQLRNYAVLFPIHSSTFHSLCSPGSFYQ
jgi:hypothetical protein